MKKVRIILTALAGVLGVGSAVVQARQTGNPYKFDGTEYRRIVNYDASNCDAASQTCVYMLDNTASHVSPDDASIVSRVGEGTYTGQLAD